jgi:ribosomal subunit interface protein
MEIIFKGRRTDVQERFRGYASAKLGRIAKLDHKAIRVDVEVSAERNPRQADRRERVELTIRSRGPAIRAEAAADDRFAALDRALAKLEERLRRSGDRRKAARHGMLSAGPVPGPRNEAEAALAAASDLDTEYLNGAGGTPEELVEDEDGQAGGGSVAWAGNGNGRYAGTDGDTGDGSGAVDDAGGVISIQMEGDGPVVVREKFHAGNPVTVDQALFEMELVGHDFYLFRDERCGLPSVVYRRHGYQYGLIRLVEETATDLAGSGGRA